MPNLLEANKNRVMDSKKKIEWFIVSNFPQLVNTIRSVEQMCKDMEERICKKMDDNPGDTQENMTFEESLAYLVDIQNASMNMLANLGNILQLFNSEVDIDNITSLGNKVIHKEIHYLTTLPSILYPVGLPKMAYRCWYRNSMCRYESLLIEDISKFPHLSSWEITPSMRIFINAFYRNCPDMAWNSKNKYKTKLVVVELPEMMFRKMMSHFSSKDKNKTFTVNDGMLFECVKRGVGKNTRYNIVSCQKDVATQEEKDIISENGLFHLDTIHFVPDEKSLKKKFNI